jgi:uracil-DNA glycosylase
MLWDKFKDHFHESWHDVMRPFIESEECDAIYEHLKTESRRGKKIAPLSSVTYKCFKVTPLNEMKVVVLGMCPYHTQLNGLPVADGLLMGCSVTDKLQPSLEQFYNAVEKDCYKGLNLKYKKTPNVEYLAEQGVLMLNAALTTEINKAGSHLKIWEPFIKYVFENAIAPSRVPVVFLGKEASKFKRYMPPLTWSFELSHPASASYKNTDWDSEGVFTKVNRVLLDEKKTQIYWLDEDLPF